MNNIYSDRLQALRAQMREHQLDAWFISGTDAHNSEYVCKHWQGRQWLSGFTGTAGSLLITHDDAGLWTDGRYYLQANQQLEGTGFRLFKAAEADVPTPEKWLTKALPDGGTIGFDGGSVNISQAHRFSDAGFLISREQDLLDALWHDRPALPDTLALDHPIEYAGCSTAEKLGQIRQKMADHAIDYHCLTALDDIAWLFNIRGQDIPYCPLVLAYALIGPVDTLLFIDEEKLPETLRQRLTTDGVTLENYSDCFRHLTNLPPDTTLSLDPEYASISLYASLPETITLQPGPQLTTAMKAIKNPVEQQHFHQCMFDDGLVMTEFMYWLNQTVPSGSVSELSAEQQLESLRQQIPGYQQPSFRTIAGYQEHGARMHYGATPESDRMIGQEGFFLLDSGGQFTHGTTDITRMFHFGSLSQQEKTDYTLVLKAHIALSRARFRAGCRGSQIDALARAPLWEQGIDYACGTGHGVGFFLNVHEGPHSLSQKWIDEPLKPGMTLTVEPGIYRDGEYGIRIENILLVVEDRTTEFGDFLRFETLTMAPIDLRPVIRSMLTQAETDWLNDYHRQVYQTLAPGLKDEIRQWLELQTRAI